MSAPDLEYLKRAAKKLLKDARVGTPSAVARLRAHRSGDAGSAPNVQLAHAQFVVARENGFSSWPTLKHEVKLRERIAATPRHPRFEAAAEAIDRGDVESLRELLRVHPELVAARGELGERITYFTGATLLHFVAWNPYPCHRTSGLGLPEAATIPESMPAIARLLLDAGSDPNAETYRGNSVLHLVMTARKPSDAGLAAELIALLLDAGARDETDDPMGAALSNHSPEAARALIERGHPLGLREAAALGMVERLPAFFETDGTLRAEAFGVLQDLTAAQLIGRAALNAYVLRQRECVLWLLDKPGDFDVTGVNNGTLLHRAVGDLPMMARLVAAGADVNNRENPFRATPQDWANHFEDHESFAWFDEHTIDRMDLWQAARWGKLERIDELCTRDPSSVHATEDIYSFPAITALRLAVERGTPETARRLRAHGADPDHVGGDGIRVRDAAAEVPGEMRDALS